MKHLVPIKHSKYLMTVFCTHGYDLMKHLEHLHKICEGKCPVFHDNVQLHVDLFSPKQLNQFGMV